MKIILPDLPEASCRHFIFCGWFTDDEKQAIQWVKKNSVIEIAKTKSHGHPAFVRAILGSTALDGHCHLDVATKEYFRPGSLPDTSTTWAAMQKLFDPLSGKKLSVEIEAVFAIAFTKLPAGIQLASLFDAVQDGVGIRLTGGRLSVTGTPIYAITWRLDEDDDQIALVRMEARVSAQIEEDCMASPFEILRDGFRSFIESGVPRAAE